MATLLAVDCSPVLPNQVDINEIIENTAARIDPQQLQGIINVLSTYISSDQISTLKNYISLIEKSRSRNLAVSNAAKDDDIIYDDAEPQYTQRTLKQQPANVTENTVAWKKPQNETAWWQQPQLNNSSWHPKNLSSNPSWQQPNWPNWLQSLNLSRPAWLNNSVMHNTTLINTLLQNHNHSLWHHHSGWNASHVIASSPSWLPSSSSNKTEGRALTDDIPQQIIGIPIDEDRDEANSLTVPISFIDPNRRFSIELGIKLRQEPIDELPNEETSEEID